MRGAEGRPSSVVFFLCDGRRRARQREKTKMNFRFHNLLGAPYRGGTLVLHEDVLLSPVGNRVAQVRAL